MSTPLLTPQDLVDTYSFSIAPPEMERYVPLIEAATAACSLYLQRDLGVSPFIEFFDGDSQVRVLSHTPVVSVTGVCVDPGRMYQVPLDPRDYRIEHETGILVFYDRVPEGRDVIKVEYTAGWDNVPADILYCIAMTVQHMRTTQSADMAGVISRTTDGGSETLDQSIPPLAVQAHLAMYRRNPVRG